MGTLVASHSVIDGMEYILLTLEQHDHEVFTVVFLSEFILQTDSLVIPEPDIMPTLLVRGEERRGEDCTFWFSPVGVKYFHPDSMISEQHHNPLSNACS